MQNVLISSAGKRVSLTRMFVKELKKVCPDGKVFTCDLNPLMAPAGSFSDGCFKVSRCSSENYVEEILTLCIDNNIGIVIPTIDTELAVLSANKERFAGHGVHIVLSSYDLVAICLDKRRTSEFFLRYHISTPGFLDKHNPVFPMFAKPYDGSRSTNTHVIRCQKDMVEDILNDPKLIFMEYVDQSKYKEYTVDMYYGRDNRVKSIVPRERVEVRAGEISKGITRKNYLVEYLKERLNYVPGAVGCICIQVFWREGENKVIGFEVNPRFGGGYPLSFFAGANFPRMILLEYLFGETVNYSDEWRDNTLMLRYDNEVIVYDVKVCQC